MADELEVTVTVPEPEPEPEPDAPTVVVVDTPDTPIEPLLDHAERIAHLESEIERLRGEVLTAQATAEVATILADEPEPEPVIEIVEPEPEPEPEPDEEPARGHWFHEPIHLGGS